MLSFFYNNDYLKRDFPCHLIETCQLERFLESRAEKGEIFASFSRFGLAGYFVESMPKKYHYCVDVYYRALNEGELNKEEFEEYKETCLARGWKYVNAFENIVVFYSEDADRPQELQADTVLKRNIMKKITLKLEFRQMPVRMLIVLPFLIMYAALFLQQRSYTGVTDKNWWDIIRFLPVVLLIAVIVAGCVRNILLIRKVYRELPISQPNYIWNKYIIVQIFFSAWIFFVAFACFWFRLYINGMCAVFVLLLLMGVLFYSLRACRKQGKDYCIWMEEQRLAFPIAAVVMIFLLLSGIFVYAPISDRDYRFSLQCTAAGYNMEYQDSGVKEEMYDSALNQDDAAFYSAPDGWRYKENPGHYTDFERITYIQDSYPVGIEHPYEHWFYVGTLTSRLFDTGKLDAYLKEKHLSLKGAEKYDLVQGVDSYLLPSGKEIIHVSNDMVIINFLDKRDERSFSLQDQTVRNAVAEKTRMNMEFYRQ